MNEIAKVFIVFPISTEIILPFIVAATMLFEIIGPVLTRVILIRIGEVHSAQS
jgi:hypothetical protein